MSKAIVDRLSTGIANLDAILTGGFLRDAVTLVGGAPGGGKTTLAMQICFRNATPERPALYIQTLSEPGTKTIKHMQPFSFFDESKVGSSVHFFDLGDIMRNKGLENAASILKEQLKRVQPAIVVIDSFRVFEDLAGSNEELRKFTYEVAIYLMVWDCTAFLIGEFTENDLNTNPLSSIVDGIMIMGSHRKSGEDQRYVQVLKMRGTDHDRQRHAVSITGHGIVVYSPRDGISTSANLPADAGVTKRSTVGIDSIDRLIADGVPAGSTFLVAGMSGTGKTILLLETIYRGSRDHGERGLYFSFEESPDRLVAVAKSLGWDLGAEIDAGRIEILFVPQPCVRIEADMQAIKDRINAFRPTRVAIDTLSLLLHKVDDKSALREKVFELASAVRRAGAIGFFSTDIPYGSTSISRYGVEETLLDGVILLTISADERERKRGLEVYKLRNTKHERGRFGMQIDQGGIMVGPRD